MKRRLCALALIASMLFLLAVPVSSAEAEGGFYQIKTAPGVTVEPRNGAGPVRAVSRNVDGSIGPETFFPGSDRLKVTLQNTQPGASYILTVSDPKTGTVYFVDQRLGMRSAVFDVAFVLPEDRTDLILSIGATAADFTKIEIPLSYVPAAEGAECPRDSTCPLAAFRDLDPGAWYHDGVHWALEAGVMKGVGADSFAPDVPVSRAMLVTMLWRQAGAPEAAEQFTFTDVLPGLWYTEAVRWAAAQGVVEGYDPKTFGPDDAVSREQVAMILWRYASMQGADVTAGVVDRLGQYLDTEQIAPWALDAMRWAVHTGLIRGVGEERLSPKANATRAQSATLLLRFTAPTPDGTPPDRGKRKHLSRLRCIIHGVRTSDYSKVNELAPCS